MALEFYRSIGGSETRNGYVIDFLRDTGRDPNSYVMVELDEIFRVLSLQAGIFYPATVCDFTDDVGAQQFSRDMSSMAHRDCMLAIKNNMWSKKRFDPNYPPIEVIDHMIEIATKSSTFTERMANPAVRQHAIRYAVDMAGVFGASDYICNTNADSIDVDSAEYLDYGKLIADWVWEKHHNICMMMPYNTIVFEIHDTIVPHINKYCLHAVDDIDLYNSQIDVYKVGFTATGKWFVEESIAILVPKDLKQGGRYYGLSSHMYADVPSRRINPVEFSGKNSIKTKTPALRTIQKVFSYTSTLHTFAAHHAANITGDVADKTLGRLLMSEYAYMFPFDMKNSLYVDIYQSIPAVGTFSTAATIGTAIALDQCNK